MGTKGPHLSLRMDPYGPENQTIDGPECFQKVEFWNFLCLKFSIQYTRSTYNSIVYSSNALQHIDIHVNTNMNIQLQMLIKVKYIRS